MNESQWIKTFEHGMDYIESIDGIDWNDAGLPSRFHRCQPQTRAWIGIYYTERCRCGATGDGHGFWISKNETRKGRARQRREDRKPRVNVTCLTCGTIYEAAKGTLIAEARQCNRCWGIELMASQGYI